MEIWTLIPLFASWMTRATYLITAHSPPHQQTWASNNIYLKGLLRIKQVRAYKKHSE